MPQILREEIRKAPPIPVVQERSQVVSLLHLLRPHQWVKNILVLIPMLLAHEWNQGWVVRNAILATICFCVTASAVYISNDLLDLEADRNHASKKFRPLASNAVSPATAIVVMLLLLGVAVALAIRLPLGFGISLLVYFVVSSLYSVYLKTKVILDICVLAGLYTIRLFAGGAATYIPISEWTLAFAMFCFLGLAAVKRYTELQSLAQDPKSLLRRGYEQTDQLTVHVLGMTSMMLSVLVLALYLHTPEVTRLYRHPEWLWLMCPVLLYWFGRIWVAAGRGRCIPTPLSSPCAIASAWWLPAWWW